MQSKAMHHFRNRRKAKELAQADVQETPVPQISHSLTIKSMKKSKKQAPEPAFEFDLSSALPETDSFRTSLMMTKLSDRFSMLREQDDPNTKIGKANDDSVLFPKRASRLNLFNHNPLNDIAEVESIHSPSRRPFAEGARTQSFASDGYASDDGGIMSRSKPGEGNNLFGGRQKLYKIPMSSASSVKNTTEADATEAEAGAMRGRHMYENDVSMSMFQQIREKEREEQRLRDQQHRSASSHNTETDEQEAVGSPSTGFSKDRGTNSSTTSGPSGRRTSTAATSVASEVQGPFAGNGSASSLVTAQPIVEDVATLEHNTVVHRRLYGQPTDQSSPTHRAVRNVMESSGRPRAASYERKPPTLAQSKSASNLRAAQSRPAPVYTSAGFRTASPPPSAPPAAIVPLDLGLREGRSKAASPANDYGSTPPLSPHASDGEDVMTYANSVQPEDRGKATAMGLFNRPQRQYDEHQFSQRQMQMHEGRISPLPPRDLPLRRNDSESPVPGTESPTEGRYSPSVNDGRQNGRLTPVSGRTSERSHRASPRPWNGASSNWVAAPTQKPPAVPVLPAISAETMSRARARADSLIRHQNDELAEMEAERMANKSAESSSHPKPLASTEATQNGTFLVNFSPSDDDLDAPFETAHPPESRRPPSGIHPALRDGTIDFMFNSDKAMPKSRNHADVENNASIDESSSTNDHDTLNGPSLFSLNNHRDSSNSTNLAPGGGLGLSGMIRSHLRNDSDRSSIYPMPAASLSPDSPASSERNGSYARSQYQPESIHSNPFELDEVNGKPHNAEAPEALADPMLLMSQKAKQILGQAAAFQSQSRSKAQEVLGEEAPRSAGETPLGRSWQEEMRMRHQRDGSTETQQERHAFNHELAERRRKVQENLKSVVETNDSSAGLVRQPERLGSGPVHPLAALKHKTSKTSIRPRQPEPQAKAMKMLGITSGMMNESSPTAPQEDMWKEEEERMLNDFARRKPRSPRDPSQDSKSPRGTSSRSSPPKTSPYEDNERYTQRSVTPTTARYPGRDRADSSMSSRTNGRNPRYRDDYDRQGSAGTSNQGAMYENRNKSPSIITLPRPSLDASDQAPYERSTSAMSGRQRSNSRPTAPGYFDQKSMTPTYSDPPSSGELAPPMPLLAQAYSANSTPPLSSPAFSTGSNASTPTIPSHPNSRDGVLSMAFTNRSATNISARKKSVSKHMISEPTLLSSTSNLPTVGLPAPPDFRPHELASPPLPTMNPRRKRQITTQNMYAGYPADDKADDLIGGLPTIPHSPNLPDQTFEERSTFSDEGEQKRFKPRSRLRKSSSEGGNMNAKLRQQALGAESPAMPTFPNTVNSRPGARVVNQGAMF